MKDSTAILIAGGAVAIGIFAMLLMPAPVVGATEVEVPSCEDLELMGAL